MIKYLFLLIIALPSISSSSDANLNVQSKFQHLSVDEKQEFFDALRTGKCEYKGIRLYGKVKIVTSFPDIKIKYVDAFPDIKVKFVSSFPNSCGEWQEVNSFPDFTVQVVDAFPDLKVKKVKSFPGIN